MRDVYIHKLSMVNFFSVGADPLILEFKEGLHLITGTNSDSPTEKNGIGKSTICEGVMFALFGSVLKDVTKNEIVNDVNNKGCEVYLHFSINDGGETKHYEIERGIKPSFCNLFEIVDGKRVDISLSIPKTNAKIESLLGVSKYVFTQTLIMSIGKSTPFFTYGKPERRKYIEGIFNIDIFSKMAKSVNVDNKSIIEKRSSANGKYESAVNTLQSYTFKRDNFIKERDELVDKLKGNVTKYQANIDDIKPTLPTLIEDDLDSELTIINDKSTKANNDLKLVRATMNKKIAETDVLVSNLANLSFDGVCSTCGQDLPDDFKVKYDAKVLEINEQIAKLRKDVVNIEVIETKSINIANSIDNDRTLLYNRKIERNNVASIYNQIINNIQIFEDNIKDSNRLIDEHMNRTNNFDDLIENVENDIKTITDNIADISKELKSIEICKMLLSDEGVKVNIIQKFRSFLNVTVNDYLGKLNAPVKCSFDEYFDCTLYTINNNDRSYDLFSSGEQKRIDLAMLFTFQDILRIQNGINIHLSFYDEILDTSLCDSGRDAVLNIIKDRSAYSAEYIISHKQKSLSIIDTEIKLEKRCGFTHLKEIVNAS